MTAALLEFQEARFGYGRGIVLDRVSLDVARGDILGLVGPNGAGKTTLLRGLLGTIAPMAGRVRWSGDSPPRIGFVPQRENLNPIWPLTAAEVVLMGRLALRMPFARFTRSDREAASRALDDVAAGKLSDRAIAELSGGQIQRILLARALAADPGLLLLDEPTAGMDLEGAASMLSLIKRLHAERSLTVVVVSHDLNAVGSIATRLALLHEGSVREGDASSILSAEVLGAVYGLEVAVSTVDRQRVVVAKERAGS